MVRKLGPPPKAKSAAETVTAKTAPEQPEISPRDTTAAPVAKSAPADAAPHVDPRVPEAVKVYYTKLTALSRRQGSNAPTSLTAYVQPLFRLAGERSKTVVLWSLVWFSLVTLSLPTLIIVGASFTSGDIIRFPPDGFSLRWYQQLWQLDDFQQALVRTFYVSVICTLISIPVASSLPRK